MQRPPSPVSARNLASVRTGETIEIQRILFDSLRDHCDALGLHEGDVAYCYLEASSHLWLTREGQRVALERDWARFIVVRRQPAGDRTQRGRDRDEVEPERSDLERERRGVASDTTCRAGPPAG